MLVVAALTFYRDRWGRDLRNAGGFQGIKYFFRKKIWRVLDASLEAYGAARAAGAAVVGWAVQCGNYIYME